MEIGIVGCGLLGSIFAPSVAAHAVSLTLTPSITLFDHDIVESRNSPSNLSVPTAVGRPKVDVVANILEGYGLPVKRMQQKLTPGGAWMLDGLDVVVGAVDNLATRKVIYDAARERGIPYLDMGLIDLLGLVTWTYGNVSNAQVDDGPVRKMPKVEKEAPCTLVTTRLVASIVAECAAKSLFLFTGGHDPRHPAINVIGREPMAGDLLSWQVIVIGGTVEIRPIFLGNVGGQDVNTE